MLHKHQGAWQSLKNYVNLAPHLYQLPIMTVLLSAKENREGINRNFWQVGENVQQRTQHKALSCVNPHNKACMTLQHSIPSADKPFEKPLIFMEVLERLPDCPTTSEAFVSSSGNFSPSHRLSFLVAFDV